MRERTKIMIRAVMCLLLTATSAVCTYGGLVLRSQAAFSDFELPEVEVYTSEVHYTSGLNSDTALVGAYDMRRTVQNVGTPREVEIHTLTDSRVHVGSVSLRISGHSVNTEPVSVNADSIMESYRMEYPEYDWDSKGKIRIIEALWEFLVNQNGVDEIIASAIIGTTMYEGEFGQQQGTYNKLQNIQSARSLLGSGECGYGVVQWTYKTRQKGLLQYYELTNELFPDDWETACVIAECCMLLRELEAYGVFDDLYSHTTIEDAVGRMCLTYEIYDGASEQWSSAGGFHLIAHEGSGYKRLEYSQNIYDYFCGG